MVIHVDQGGIEEGLSGTDGSRIGTRPYRKEIYLRS